MDLYAAVDVRGGGAVRLTQGDFARERGYGDPVDLAVSFAAAGAPWVHVVDLDAARTGDPVNRPVIRAIAAAVPVPVQSGGGVRSAADVEALLGAGVARVVLGTAAAEDPRGAAGLVAAYPGRVALGVDYRRDATGRTEVAVRGWEAGSGLSVEAFLDRFAEVAPAALVVTAIERDGTLAGPDLEGLAGVLAASEVPVIASGGVGSLDDLRALADLSVPAPGSSGRRVLGGVVTGRALVDGRLGVAEGVAACAPSG